MNVLPVGVVGDDEPGRILLKYFRHKRIPVSGVLKDKTYTTVTKTRILAGMTHTARQQVVRVDREPRGRAEQSFDSGALSGGTRLCCTSPMPCWCRIMGMVQPLLRS